MGTVYASGTPHGTPFSTQYSREYADTPFFALAEEFQLRNDKQKASGLSKTDYLVQAIENSEVKIYSIEESLAPLIHEIRKIGTIRRENEIVMKKILDFLNHPKFDIGSKK